MFINYLKRVVEGGELTSSEAYDVINLLVTEEVPENQAAAFFAALRLRKETGEELYGFASALLEKAIKDDGLEGLLDTCGTGGDGCRTFNISTAAAIVCAACGVQVAKHGNRAVTSRAGSADVLESLGVRVNLDLEEARAVLEEVGIVFLFAPGFHPVMKKFGSMRRSLGIATAFNFLGPLVNPFFPSFQVLGVSDPAMLEPVAQALFKLGRKRALVVHAENGMDEISHVGTTRMARVDGHGITLDTFEPAQLGFRGDSLEGIQGGDAADNARIIKEVLAGNPGPARDVVLLNAAAALVVAEKAGDMADGLRLAAEAIDSGRATAKLGELVRLTQGSRVKEC
ncbi:MAG: anthranilate phosphoribosyltransferase [Syntrophomonadaceae bacterium]|nr:anthranilate phosphoribosyltransferase [Syntrophomonadaceae bacterium]